MHMNDFLDLKGVVDDEGRDYRYDLAIINHEWMSEKGIMYKAAEADFAALPLGHALGDVDDYLESKVTSSRYCLLRHCDTMCLLDALSSTRRPPQ
jgi:hypothetical protein